MIVGVIGSGSIGPDLAYGFLSALAREPGSKVYLVDIKQEALDAGVGRIQGYMKKGLARGKLNPKAAKAMSAALIPTLDINDLADCDYVLEAASEDLPIKRMILKNLEAAVRPECLIGFATSGLPRSWIASEAVNPERCFVNHPFFPAWRALPIEVVLSDNEALGASMLATLEKLGKVPIVTADVPCFAADDIFANYCSEAARIAEEGLATPAQVNAIVNDAIGGGGPFNVLDLTRGNLLIGHCQMLMAEATENAEWLTPPAILEKQGNSPWIDRKNPGDPSYDDELAKTVLDRMLAVLFARTYFVADNGICEPTELDWLTRMALGFRKGLLALAADYGAERVHDIVTRFAETRNGFHVPKSIADKQLLDYHRNLTINTDDGIQVITIMRPEVKNALSQDTLAEIKLAVDAAQTDDSVKGIVLTGYGGALAGADITELAALDTPELAEALCNDAYVITDSIAKSKKPIVAAVNGPVLGGGCELAMTCHGRVGGPGLMLGQPEVNLGIIPGYGGTQRLPRLIGLERAVQLLRTGAPVGAKQACAWGWATGDPVADVIDGAKALIRKHLAGDAQLAPVDESPVAVPAELPKVDIGHRSLAIDAILVDVLREGLAKPLSEGLAVEAAGFGRCKRTVDMDIGMKNFSQNGPRVPATFLHE